MSDIAGFPTGHPARETPAPAAESYTELPAEQVGLAAPYAPLTEPMIARASLQWRNCS